MTEYDSRDLSGLETAEDRLQAVVAANDADGLALLLHDDLLATAHDGSFATKQEDVAGYASGRFRVTSYRQLRRRSLLRSGTGVTAVRAHIQGGAGEEDFEVVMDYTRTWVHEQGRWQVLAAHLSLVPATDPDR
jgi:Domain of unknown function (DUF4440)